MERLERNSDFLRCLLKGPGSKRCKLIKKCSPDQLKTICDICFNILEGNVPLKDKKKKQLAKFADTIRILGRKGRTPLTKKKKLLVQKGEGILTAILVPIISAIAGSLISRKRS